LAPLGSLILGIQWIFKRRRFFIMIFAIIVLLAGCMSIPQPVCRHRAVYYAYTAGERYPTRIAIGYFAGSPVWHCESQVKIKTKWFWIRESVTGYLYTSKDKTKGFNIIEYIQFDEFIAHYTKQMKYERIE